MGIPVSMDCFTHDFLESESQCQGPNTDGICSWQRKGREMIHSVSTGGRGKDFFNK